MCYPPPFRNNEAYVDSFNRVRKMHIKTLFAILLAVVAVALPAAAKYPTRPIRIMVPYSPGGNSDVTTRIVADKLKDILGVSVVVENKAGASGMIGSDQIARSAPDGYNLLVSANSMAVIPPIYGNAPYDWKTALQPISHIGAVPAVIVVTPSSSIKTFAEFVQMGIKEPQKLFLALSGIGTTNHIIAELLSDRTGAKYSFVQYKGSGQASIDVISGQIPAQIDQLSTALGHIRAGKLRPLAVTSERRMPQLPDVPTVKELRIKGLEDFSYSTFTGLFGPAGMSEEVLSKLHEGMVRALADPITVDRLTELGEEIKPSTPEELAAMLDREDKVVVPLLKRLGIRAE
jgi:tripartite-type tricarboxylate transporter receptor subunit TctC